MDATESVSTGCFPYKAKKKQKIANSEDYLPSQDKKTVLQYRTFLSMLKQMNKEIQVLQTDINSGVFNDLLAFVKRSHDDETSSISSVHEIPAVIFITGVNTSDHAQMFFDLCAVMRQQVTPHVCVLLARDCRTSKALLSQLVKQLSASFQEVVRMYADNVDDDEEEDNFQSLGCHTCSLSTIVKRFHYMLDRMKMDLSSSKNKIGRGAVCASKGAHAIEKVTIVVIFEDVENFQPTVLQDFIVTCSNYIDRLPLVLVFGIATSVDVMHRLLPAAVSTLLCMEKFQAPPSTQYLTSVIDRIFINEDFPFKLGGRVFQLLLDMFLCHHFSVIDFTSAIKFCMLDHYVNTPLSSVCCPSSMLSHAVHSLRSNDIRQLRQLPSLMRYHEQLEGRERSGVTDNDEEFKVSVKCLLLRNRQVHRRIRTVLYLLHTLTYKLPSRPLGKQVRELYAFYLESEIHNTKEFLRAMDLLRAMAQPELRHLLADCIQIIVDHGDDPELLMLRQQLQTFVDRLDQLDGEVAGEADQPELKLARMDLRSLQQTLKEIGKKKKLLPYENIRSEILLFLTDVVRDFLPKVESIVMHELLYYDDVDAVRNHLYPSPRFSIHRALAQPMHYLKCSCCDPDDVGISATLPDVCIAYKLHLECGQLINLYDWFQK